MMSDSDASSPVISLLDPNRRDARSAKALLVAESGKLTYRDLQERRALIQKRMREHVGR